METSLSDFKNKRYLQQLRKINARDPSGSKQSETGAYAPNEYGSAVLYGFPPQYSKKELWVRLTTAQSTMKFVIRLCASEVDRKSIHSDVYHEGRWLLWYLILSQTITMQSVHTPCRPPPAAETTLNNNLTIREYCFGTETARAKSGEHLKV